MMNTDLCLYGDDLERIYLLLGNFQKFREYDESKEAERVQRHEDVVFKAL